MSWYQILVRKKPQPVFLSPKPRLQPNRTHTHPCVLNAWDCWRHAWTEPNWWLLHGRPVAHQQWIVTVWISRVVMQMLHEKIPAKHHHGLNQMGFGFWVGLCICIQSIWANNLQKKPNDFEELQAMLNQRGEPKEFSAYSPKKVKSTFSTMLLHS